MNYFSKRNYQKQRKIRGIIIGLIVGLVLAGITLIITLNTDLDLDFAIAIPVGVFIGMVIGFYLMGQKKSIALINTIRKQERLLNADFDQDMTRYQVPRNAKTHTCPTWFMDTTVTSEVNGIWVYHIDFVRKVETESGMIAITFITGEREEVPERTGLALQNWFEANKANQQTRTYERTFDQPYAPFVVEGNSLIYEITGFKIDVFQQIIDEEMPMEGCWYDWELLIENYLQHKVPHLDDVMDLDSDFDNSLIRVIAPDAHTLEEFAKGFRDMCDDDALMKELLESNDSGYEIFGH